jgi:glycosyltransferase involved in cell wall biosynthesis
MNATFTVIIPTLGRETLGAAIRSALSQCAKDDWVRVIADGALSTAAMNDVRDAAYGPGCYGRHFSYDETPVTHDFGCTQRRVGLDHARGQTSHVLFLGDDDELAPGALDVFRAHAEGLRPMLQQMLNFRAEPGHGLLRGDKMHHYCDGMAVLPNKQELFAPWWTARGEDAAWLSDTLYNFLKAEPRGVIQLPEVTYFIRPWATPGPTPWSRRLERRAAKLARKAAR